MLVERWSARTWFARILVTWGFCSMGMALVKTPAEFYVARCLLGLAEAGFFPGIIVYFTHWFTRAERGRAMAGIVLGIPISLSLGAQVSSWLLEATWFDLAGWQWLFIVEGAPAVLMGLALPFLLTDRPAQAKWLTPAEREWLEQTLEAERQDAARQGSVTIAQALRMPAVWILAMGILTTNIGGYAMLFWMPTTVKTLLRRCGNRPDLRGSAGVHEHHLCLWTGRRLAVRTIVRPHRQHKWHCVGGQVSLGVCLAAAAIPGQSAAAVITWLCLVGFFATSWPSPFWVLPTLTLSSSAAAVSIGFINMSANFAGVIGPPVVGELQDLGVDIRTCLLFPVACYIYGGSIVSFIRIPPRRSAVGI